MDELMIWTDWGMRPVEDSLSRYREDNCETNMISFLSDDFYHPLMRFTLTMPKDMESTVKFVNNIRYTDHYPYKAVDPHLWEREEIEDSVTMRSYPMDIYRFVDLIKKTPSDVKIEIIGVFMDDKYRLRFLDEVDESTNLIKGPVQMERYGPVYDAIIGPRRHDTRDIYQRKDEAKADVVNELLSDPKYCSLISELFDGIVDADRGAAFPARDEDDVKYKRFEGWILSGHLRKDPIISINAPYFSTDRLKGAIFSRAQVRQKWGQSEPEMPELVDGQEEMYAADLMMGMFIGRKQFMQEQLTMYLEQTYEFQWYPDRVKEERVSIGEPYSSLSVLHWGISGDSMKSLRVGLPKVARVFDDKWEELRNALKLYEAPWALQTLGMPRMNYSEDTRSNIRASFELGRLDDDTMRDATKTVTDILLKGRLNLRDYITEEEFDEYNPGE